MARPFLLGLLAAAVALSCAPNRRMNPDFCDPPNDIDPCASRGKVCNTQSFSCVKTDAALEGRDATPLIDGGTDTPGDTTGDTGGDTGDDTRADSDGDGGGGDVVIACGPCTGNTPICRSSTGACGACATDTECARLNAATPFCDTGVGACVACKGDTDCQALSAAKPWCLERRACVACRTGADCPNATPICDSNNSCVGCTSDSACAARNSSLPGCRVADGACVECTKPAHCPSVTKPICDANTCGRCTADRQCADKQGTPNPGVCMSHADGRCATDAEVLYVRPFTGVCDNGSAAMGTAAAPFCTTMRAIDAVSVTKSIIVIRPGTTTPLTPWSYTANAAVPELTVIGQEGATIGPGGDVGITIVSGRVYLRGLSVSGMFGVGVEVRPGNDTLLRMNGCIITKNAGGLLVNGAGFEINNSVFADNSLGTITGTGGASIEFGGVYLGGLAARPTVFRNNTVYRNAGPGLVCGGPYPVKGVLIAGNVSAEVLTCTFDLSSEVPGPMAVYDPKFDMSDTKNPYRLTSLSTCVNKGTPSNDAPPDDIDGNPRPFTGGSALKISDCGAHELQK